MNGKPGVKNMTIGQAYYNLNKTSPRFGTGADKFMTTRNSMFGGGKGKSIFGNDVKARTHHSLFKNM